MCEATLEGHAQRIGVQLALRIVRKSSLIIFCCWVSMFFASSSCVVVANIALSATKQNKTKRLALCVHHSLTRCAECSAHKFDSIIRLATHMCLLEHLSVSRDCVPQRVDRLHKQRSWCYKLAATNMVHGGERVASPKCLAQLCHTHTLFQLL